jgi:hypothetical protein
MMAMSDLHIFTKCDIFTPDNISQLMSSKLSHRGSLLEPCVGTGNLLKFINADVYDEIDVYEIKEEYLQKIGYWNKIGNDSMMHS